MYAPKILHLSTYDTYGGAARAALRIFEAQVKNGINCSMLTLVKQSRHPLISTPKNIDSKFKIRQIHDYLQYYRNYSKGNKTFLRCSSTVLSHKRTVRCTLKRFLNFFLPRERCYRTFKIITI